MLKKIMGLCSKRLNFKSVDALSLSFVDYQLIMEPTRLIPLIQKPQLSDQMKKVLRFYRRKPRIVESDMRQLTRRILIESLRVDHQQFNAVNGLHQNYYAQPSIYSNYYGNIDYLLFSDGGRALLPVFFDSELNTAKCIAGALWRKNHYIEQFKEKLNFSSCSVVTNGNQWVLCQIFKKAELSLPLKSQYLYGRVYQNQELVRAVCGLIKVGLGRVNKKEYILSEYYKFVDQSKYMGELSEPLDKTNKGSN